MASPMKRGLQMWEQIGFSLNVSLYLELEGQTVGNETISKAWKALQAEHPVLRMGIEFCDNVPTFVELSDPTVRLETAPTLYPKWRTKLQEYANEMRDWTEAVVFMELASSGNQHQLFLTINHASIDGIGLFHLCNSFLSNLGRLTQGQPVSTKSPRPLRDIFAKLDTWLPIGISKQAKPAVPEKYMPTLAADRMLEEVEPHVAAVWSELDGNWTQALLSRCKEHGVTVQAAISAASMLAMVRAQARNHPLPQNMLMQAPINMRSQAGSFALLTSSSTPPSCWSSSLASLSSSAEAPDDACTMRKKKKVQVSPPIEAEECVFAMSYLWWCQQLAADEKLWDVVAKSSKALKEEKSKKSGLAFWHRVQKDFWSPPYTVSASFVGVSPVQTAYGDLRVKQQHMMVATYGLVKPDDAITMSHAHTFDGRLHTVFAFTRPAVSEDMGQEMAKWQQDVLKKLAAPDSDDTQVSQLVATNGF